MEFKSFRELSDAFEKARAERTQAMVDRAAVIEVGYDNPETIIGRIIGDAAFFKMMEKLSIQLAKRGVDARPVLTSKEPIVAVVAAVLAAYEAVTIDISPNLYDQVAKVLGEIDDKS